MKKFAVSLNIRESSDGTSDFLMHPYVTFLQSLGIAPVLVPNTLTDVSAYLTALEVDGLVLTGGSDIDPARYGQADRHAIRIVTARDQTEFALLDWATARHQPVLGICRGIQTINVYFGGGLVQDIPAQMGERVNHDGAIHPVQIVEDQIAALLGTRELLTNSHHHQGITATLLANDLIACRLWGCSGTLNALLLRGSPITRCSGIFWIGGRFGEIDSDTPTAHPSNRSRTSHHPYSRKPPCAAN